MTLTDPNVLRPDSRIAQFIGGFDDAGQPLPITAFSLQQVTAKWPTSRSTPTGIADLLDVSRKLFAHGFFVYEFISVGVHWSLLAVEAALKARLESGESFHNLINRAQREALLDDDAADRLHAGRKIRNDLSHPDGQKAWNIGVAASMIQASHKVVAELFTTGSGHEELR
jgi:hypothetical protein